VIKPFLLLLALLSLMVMGVVWHYLQRTPSQELKALVGVTHQATPSLSVSFDQPRGLQGARHNPLYPELSTTSTMEFVYVQ
jgi:hypothetical protein